MLVDEITFLDEIFELEKKEESLEHIEITNVSYWNSSLSYKKHMEKYIKLNLQQDIFDYTYTYDISKYQRLELMKKLKVINPEDSMCLLNSSGTNTIQNVINFLKFHNYKKLGILIPSYFSVEQSCKVINLTYENVIMHYSDGNYHIPLKYILENHFDAVWLTSPAYSTAISYKDFHIDVLKKLFSEKILVIADETLALPNQMLTSRIPINDYFFSICSPHKPLFINKIKFSVLICPKKNDDFLEQWIDILSGSLSYSNLIAIQHFLSYNFNECMNAALQWYGNSIKEMRSIVRCFPNIQYNLDELGPYKTIYLKSPKLDIGKLDNINSIIIKDYVSYIPIEFNGYYGFRVNLSLNPDDLSNALYRILKFYA